MARILFVIAFWYLPLICNAQQWQWLRSEGGDINRGGIRSHQGNGICTDNAGNVYVSGYFAGKGVFGSDTLNCYENAGLLMKYDSVGTVLWARKVTIGGMDVCSSVCTDPSQNVIVGGYKSGSAIRTFTAKYDGKGSLIWMKDSKGEDAGASYIKALVTDKKGNIYAAGDCQGVFSFDTFSMGEHKKYTIFLVKYSPEGKVMWLRYSQPSDKYTNEGLCLAISENGSIYMGGTFDSVLSIDKIRVANKGEADVFVAKYDANGNMGWIKTWGSKKKDRVHSIATDKNGNIYLTANFPEGALVGNKQIIGEHIMKLSATGVPLWQKQVGVSKESYTLMSYLTTSKDGELYLTGLAYYAVPLFGESQGYNGGAADLFVAKCNAQGEKIWVEHAGSVDVDEGRAICIDKNKNIYLTGHFYGTVDFGKTTVRSKSGYDGIWVGKMR